MTASGVQTVGLRVQNRVLLTLALGAGIGATAAGFVSLAPNRLVSGRPVTLWAGPDYASSAGIAALIATMILASFLPTTKTINWIVAALGLALVLLILFAAGHAAMLLTAGAGPAARASPGAAFWILLFCAALAIVNAMQALRSGPLSGLAIAAFICATAAAMADAGIFNALSIVREYQNNRDIFGAEIGRHCTLVLGSLLPALLLGVPLGVIAVGSPRLRGSLFAILNILQTIPSIALFGILIAPLSALADAVPALAFIGVGGIGLAPAIIALVLYALLPVVRNTYTGLAGVDRAVIETAEGMGLTRRQIFPQGRAAAGVASAARRSSHRHGSSDRARRGRGAGRRRWPRHLCLSGARAERGRPCPAGRDTGDPAGACRGLPAADGDCLRSRARRAMIDLQEVSRRYGDRRVVDRVSLSVAEGEFCVLIGPSGCGKSTTVKMINRLVPLTAGSIRIGGEDVMRVPIERLRRRIGYAIQSIGLFPHWTVEDNIATVPRLLRWPGRRVRDRVTELLELLRLDPEDYRAKYPQQLSGGQQQRVGVARALAADPEVLLMDEPFGALDPVTRDVLQSELARIHKKTGKTIIFVTHDVDEALRLASSIAIMDEGRLVQFGTPLDILERPASDFVRNFVGRRDIGLKRLAVLKVGDRLRQGEVGEGEPIDLDQPLREALSQMIARHTERLPVRGPDGRLAGTVVLADLVK